MFSMLILLRLKVQNLYILILLCIILTIFVTSGLKYLHKAGFVHADVKPRNLLWSPQDGCMKIIDFSLTFHVEDKVCYS